MEGQILFGFLLTMLPIFELRGGLPLIVEYTVKNGISVWPYFLIVLILNILTILIVFLFLDFFHEILLNLKSYKKFFEKVLGRIQRKIHKVQETKYLALMLLVAVPLPGTGAWTGTLIAWLLKLNRLKSFIAISAGIIIAGILVLSASLGFFSGVY
jgi:uncharacterized membrane protein